MDEEEPVLKPSDLLAYRRAHRQVPDFPPPQAVIFCPQKSLTDYVLRRYSARRIKGFLGDFHVLNRSNGKIAISSNFGIGAPAIAALTDQFAALGARQFALIGLAGGLQPELKPGSLVVSTSALRAEGVSRHYLPSHPTVNSSKEFVYGLSAILTEQKHPHFVGSTWTTDAPFRELRKDVTQHRKEGVLAVEMGAAGMLAVASSLHLDAVAAFSIADQLSDGVWRIASDLQPAQKGLTILFDAFYEFFISQLRK